MKGPPSLRLFLALWPDSPVRAAIAGWQHSWVWPPQAAIVASDRLHLTLHFLGNVPTDQLPQLGAGLRVGFQPFAMSLDQGEVWPNGVAVLRPEHTPAPLKLLHAALGDELTQLGLPPEARPFRAHVTLARRAWRAVPPPRGPQLRWEAVHGYALVQSLPAGAGYRVLERFG